MVGTRSVAIIPENSPRFTGPKPTKIFAIYLKIHRMSEKILYIYLFNNIKFFCFSTLLARLLYFLRLFILINQFSFYYVISLIIIFC